MNSLNTLFFPGTDIHSIRQYPLFLLFQKIHIIRPVESKPANSNAEPTDSFIKSGFCQVHTPCPLGNNRDRFLRLVADIKNRKDDYAAQLSSLILAGKSGNGAESEDTEQSIINSFLNPKVTNTDSVNVDAEEKLWQARLILAIGEILDQEEEEIARNLAMVEDEQNRLFKELHGDEEESFEDNPFAELSQLEGNLKAASSGNIKNRFLAWKRLFLADELPECEIFLTTSQDGEELLLEMFEKKTSQPAPLAATLELPGLIGWDDVETVKNITLFTEENSELLTLVHESFTELSQQQNTLELQMKDNNVLAALTGQWKKSLESLFPAKQFGRIPVRCYLFPGITCSALLGKTVDKSIKAQNGLLVSVS